MAEPGDQTADGAPRPLAGDAKVALRRSLRLARRSLPEAQRRQEEAATVAALLADVSWTGAGVASYVALPDELDLDQAHTAWWAAGQPVWLPRVLGPGRLAWHPITDPGQLRPGSFGIREPDPGIVPADPLPAGVTILVPGLGFGPAGARLGQGGGFYDRLLDSTHRAIGIAFACQWCAVLPLEAHDRPVDALLCGGRWHHFGSERTRE